MADSAGTLFESLLSIMSRLRSEGGCPWDREQTRESLKPYLIEEAHAAEDLAPVEHRGAPQEVTAREPAAMRSWAGDRPWRASIGSGRQWLSHGHDTAPGCSHPHRLQTGRLQ